MDGGKLSQGVADPRPKILAALADPVRLAMVDHLLYGDASPSELGAHVEVLALDADVGHRGVSRR